MSPLMSNNNDKNGDLHGKKWGNSSHDQSSEARDVEKSIHAMESSLVEHDSCNLGRQTHDESFSSRYKDVGVEKNKKSKEISADKSSIFQVNDFAVASPCATGPAISSEDVVIEERSVLEPTCLQLLGEYNIKQEPIEEIEDAIMPQDEHESVSLADNTAAIKMNVQVNLDDCSIKQEVVDDSYNNEMGDVVVDVQVRADEYNIKKEVSE